MDIKNNPGYIKYAALRDAVEDVVSKSDDFQLEVDALMGALAMRLGVMVEEGDEIDLEVELLLTGVISDFFAAVESAGVEGDRVCLVHLLGDVALTFADSIAKISALRDAEEEAELDEELVKQAPVTVN